MAVVEAVALAAVAADAAAAREAFGHNRDVEGPHLVDAEENVSRSCLDMLSPFIENLPEYGYVMQNFWNNANQHVVPDPFGVVK